MSGQALDLRRSIQIVRRYWILVGVAAVLGLLASAGYAMLNPPGLTSNALVVLPTSTRQMATQVVIAQSEPVLMRAQLQADPGLPLVTLRSRIQVKQLTGNVLSISGQGRTAAQAERLTNAVADSYMNYLRTGESLLGTTNARLLAPAATATGSSLPFHLAIFAGLGVLIGALAGAVLALALGRSDQRLRERDEIADVMGVPVIASVATGHPSDPEGWAKLLQEYEPGVIHAWSMRRALNQLGLVDLDLHGPGAGADSSLAVLSLASDRKALAAGPQLAVFAASLGIPTALVIGSQQDEIATASLRAACATVSAQQTGRPANLQIIVAEQGNISRLDALAVIVGVVDSQAPRVTDTMRAASTVLAVSAGAATAEQLARVAVSAAAAGRSFAGVIVTDPDSTDQTTGRLPQPTRPRQRRPPGRMTGTSTEIRR